MSAVEIGNARHTRQLLEMAYARGGLRSVDLSISLSENNSVMEHRHHDVGPVTYHKISMNLGDPFIFFVKAMMELDWVGTRCPDLYHVSGFAEFGDGTTVVATHPRDLKIMFYSEWRIYWTEPM